MPLGDRRLLVFRVAAEPMGTGSFCRVSWFFFFFQAEDGIRDWSVTGVQTCALPICSSDENVENLDYGWVFCRVDGTVTANIGIVSIPKRLKLRMADVTPPGPLFTEIGRASCRERV